MKNIINLMIKLNSHNLIQTHTRTEESLTCYRPDLRWKHHRPSPLHNQNSKSNVIQPNLQLRKTLLLFLKDEF